ncbi:type VII secretion integral membrane protein EccD [Gandjariella thermophila]|uniref:EccD-like transmembrane domain-containing protein n=1 Tax=Gandjariella thermophila TaxID=1931992 RepID=A0A4D4JD15_9PSEU|nr:type VII secretion integral membrane protein EccD [Gandjariella thermophila]GDY33524.1 hypothetical protein GTS_51570 [Gandjariella thermophila]
MTAMTPPPSATTGRLTRVTLIGPRRRIDLVLPSEEPIGTLLPEMVAMVGYRPAGEPRGYQVSRLDGQVLEPGSSLRRAGVADGALLRIDPLTEAPPAAIVHDVSDEVADDLARRRGRWNEAARRWTATGAVVAAATLATVLAAATAPPAALAAAGLLALLAGAALAVLGPRAVGISVLLGGSAVALTAVPSLTAAWPQRWAWWAVGVGVTVITLGVATRQHRAGLLGGGTLLALLTLWAAMLALGLPLARTAAVMALVTVAALGVLPRVAMLASGLTRLDDRQSGEAPVTRRAAESAVDAAHRGLALACVATAASGALAGWVLAWAATGWTVALACLLGIAVLLRLRAFPLTVEVVGLVAASFVVATGLIGRWVVAAPAQRWGGVAAAAGIAAVGLVVLGYQPESHVRARARQFADRLEGLAVVALVPVAVGVFGVYSRLLDTF